MPPPAVHPYHALTPDCVLDALDSVGLRGDGRLLHLNSYENRVLQVFLEDGSVVVAKFYRPNVGGSRWTDAQILEEHTYTQELADAEIPVVAPLALPTAGGPSTLAHFKGFRFAVTPRRGGHAPELDDPQTLEWLGRFIGRIHAVGCTKPFAHRPQLDVASFGEEPRAWLLAHDWIPPEVLPAWRATMDDALYGVRRCFERAGDVARIRLHGDCHGGNVLWTDAGPHFVDFDDARTGPAVQDLWMLLSGERADMTRQLADVLAGYEDFMPFDRRELHVIEALRTLRLIHYSAWLARRWDDPAFPPAFPWFNAPAYWQEQVIKLREQVEAMAQPPLNV